MRVKIIEKLGGRVLNLDAVVVIVEDLHGNPIQLACELQPGVHELGSISENPLQFHNMLRALGHDKIVVAEKLDTGSPPEGSRLLYGPGMQ